MADYRYALRRAEQIGAQRAAEREEDRRIRESLGLEEISLGRERLMQERELESERQAQREQELRLQRQTAGKQFGVDTEGFGLAGLAPQLEREVSEKRVGVGGPGFGLAGMELGLQGQRLGLERELGRGRLGLEGRQIGLQEAIGQQEFGVQGPGFAPAQRQGGFGQTLGFGQPSRGLSRFGLRGEQLKETIKQRRFGQKLQRQTQQEKFMLDARAEYEKNPPWRQTGKMVKDPRTGKEIPEEVVQPFDEYVQEILDSARRGRQEQKRKSFSDLWD